SDCSLAARLLTPDSVLHSDDATARALSFRDMDAQDAMFEVRLDVVDVNGGRKRKNARHPFARHFLHKVRAALSIGRSLWLDFHREHVTARGNDQFVGCKP